MNEKQIEQDPKDEPKPEPKPKVETLTIPKSSWDEMNKQMAEMKKMSEMLMQIADRKALAMYYSRHKTEVPKEVRVRTIAGKVIIGWRTIQDEVFQDPLTRGWKEIQIVELMYEDGTTEQMPLMDFNRRFEHIKCQRLGVINDEASGKTAFKLVRPNGQELTIAVEFVN